MLDRRKDDDNGDWDDYRMFVTEELKRQGNVQVTMLSSIQEINNRLISQESKIRNVSGIISFAVSGIVSLISGVVLFIIKRGQG